MSGGNDRSADRILEILLERPPTLGGGRLLCIDGPAGSGKTTFAQEVQSLVRAQVVHTDALCPGWGGLPRVPGILSDLLKALADGGPGTYPGYDWNVGVVSGPVVVEPVPLLIVEGVGAGSRSLRPWRTALVWLDDDPEVRRSRAIARDGETFAPYWEQWAAAEDTYFATEADRESADLVIDGR